MISVFLSNRGTVKSNILRKTLSRLRDDEVTPSTFQNYVCPAAPVGDIPEGVPASAVTNCLPVQNMIFQSGVGCTDVNWCEPKEGTVGLHWPLLAISRNYNNMKSTFHQQEPQTLWNNIITSNMSGVTWKNQTLSQSECLSRYHETGCH